jgi:hypothetical protein
VSWAVFPPWIFLPAVLQTRLSHALAQAAFLDEGLFEAMDLTVKEVGGHLDQTDDDIGANGRVGVFDALSECPHQKGRWIAPPSDQVPVPVAERCAGNEPTGNSLRAPETIGLH